MKVKELKEILKSCNDDDNLNLYIEEDENSKVSTVLYTSCKWPQDLYRQEYKRATLTCYACNKQFAIYKEIDAKVTYQCPYCRTKI